MLHALIRTRSAFTLIELLVVITIIVLLLSLLAPAMDRAITAAEAVRCAANQKGIGQAQAFYLNDHKRRYPQIPNWGMLVGNLGNSGGYDSNLNDVTARPLNVYLGYTADGSIVPVAECPSDAGDSHAQVQVASAYESFGTSYLPASHGDYSRVTKVYGVLNLRQDVPAARQTQFKPPHNKLLLADWCWQSNRPVEDAKAQWHYPGPKRLYNVLMSDVHVEFIDLDEHPAGRLGDPPPNGDLLGKPNRSAAYW